MKPDTEEWVRLAEDDLKAAGLLLGDGFLRHCIFECQQALEKLLKAMWVEQAPQGYPPREHNLASLAEKVRLRLSTEQLQFLDELSKQYTPSRYADVGVEYSREEAEDYHQKTREQFGWLRQQLS